MNSAAGNPHLSLLLRFMWRVVNPEDILANIVFCFFYYLLAVCSIKEAGVSGSILRFCSSLCRFLCGWANRPYYTPVYEQHFDTESVFRFLWRFCLWDREDSRTMFSLYNWKHLSATITPSKYWSSKQCSRKESTLLSQWTIIAPTSAFLIDLQFYSPKTYQVTWLLHIWSTSEFLTLSSLLKKSFNLQGNEIFLLSVTVIPHLCFYLCTIHSGRWRWVSFT